MKWVLSILIALSLSFNAYLVYAEMRDSENQKVAQRVNALMGIGVNNIKWKDGLNIFQTKLRSNNSALLKKKYFYINIWTTWCKPCIREMPWLDSIAGTLDKDVGYFFLTDMSESVTSAVLKKTDFHLNNFVFLNDMNDFVSSICNERKIKNKTYPMVLILNNEGDLLHFSIGAYSSKSEAAGFVELINSLK